MKQTKASKLSESYTAIIERLIDAIESEHITAELAAFYKQSAKFHQYSLRNRVLITFQDPLASQVAGYKAWNKFNRHVMKGEHGIGILAPHKYTALNDSGIEEDRIGFHATTVFDVRQTDGEPLEDPTHVLGDQGSELYDILSRFGTSLDMTIRMDDLNGLDGYCTANEIVIDESLPTQNQVGVLIHELAHKLFGHHESDIPKNVREWEAETVSYIVCESHSIKNKAPQYLKIWGMTRDGIKESIKKISNISGKILTGIEKYTP